MSPDLIVKSVTLFVILVAGIDIAVGFLFRVVQESGSDPHD